MQKAIPVIDLFAGPGGLCEGFSSVLDQDGHECFDVKVSIEKDPVAHRTLHLRALFRKLPKENKPEIYYQYIRGEVSREDFLEHPQIKAASDAAHKEAKCAELGVTSHKIIDGWIQDALGDQKNWVLIGGPPCQAYSLAGRSRMKNVDPKAFEKDKRHFLYTEYLRIIQQFSPSVFIMENVKGMLNSTHKGNSIFDRILSDLQEPKKGLSYQIRSLVVSGTDLEPSDYVIKSENFGIPQCRHRVILFGVRSDVAEIADELTTNPHLFQLEKTSGKVSTGSVLDGMPSIRSRVSKEEDSHKKWMGVLEKTTASFKTLNSTLLTRLIPVVTEALEKAKECTSTGSRFLPANISMRSNMPKELQEWLLDKRIGGVIQHESRSHMFSDLQRYMFASSYAKSEGQSPTLHNFPKKLLPDHLNVDQESIPFSDRFRVQLKDEPARTVVAHIQKDGHYYIHHDPSQCRSLTVREAARLQTFPDNYFFEGNRTQQYGQVGNAVPPLLAHKIAKVIYKFASINNK